MIDGDVPSVDILTRRFEGDGTFTAFAWGMWPEESFMSAVEKAWLANGYDDNGAKTMKIGRVRTGMVFAIYDEPNDTVRYFFDKPYEEDARMGTWAEVEAA